VIIALNGALLWGSFGQTANIPLPLPSFPLFYRSYANVFLILLESKLAHATSMKDKFGGTCPSRFKRRPRVRVICPIHQILLLPLLQNALQGPLVVLIFGRQLVFQF
jgi:hypothetical protein